jgi:putative oxidoreductase
LTTEAGDHSPASIFQPGNQWEQSMDKALGVQNTMVDSVVLLASRLLLAGIFVHEGVFLATNFAAASTAMAKVGVPTLAVIGTIVLQLVAGIAIAIGWHARLGAAALGLFCLATAILFHLNFANRNELLHFEKDLAIAGGMFVLMLRGAGDYSVGTFASRRISYDDGWQRLVRAFESSGNIRDEAMISKKQADRP